MINKKQTLSILISSILSISVIGCNSGSNGMQKQMQSNTVQNVLSLAGISSQASLFTASLITDAKNNAYVIDLSNGAYTVKTFNGSSWVNVGTEVDNGILNVTGGKNSANLGVDKEDNLLIAYAKESSTYIKKFNSQTQSWDLVNCFPGVFYNYTFNFDSKNQGYLSYYYGSYVYVNKINLDYSLTKIGQFGASISFGKYVDNRNVSYTKLNPSSDQLTAMHTERDPVSGTPLSYIAIYDSVNNSWSNRPEYYISQTINYAINKNGTFIILEQDAKDSALKIYINGSKYNKNIVTTSAEGSSVIADSNGDFYVFYANTVFKLSLDSATGIVTETTLSNTVANSSKTLQLLATDNLNNLFVSYLSNADQIVEVYK